MSGVFETLQGRYQALVARRERGEAGEEFAEDVGAFIADARQAGAAVADLNQRSQLRAWMRFLADALYDATGAYPDLALQPLARGQLARPQPDRRPAPSPSPPLVWALVGGAAAVVIAAGLVAVGWLSRPREIAGPTPTPPPVPFVSHAALGTELDPGGALVATADTFCLGTPEIVAEFTLERIAPGTRWHWEVRRDDDVVAAQPTAPWEGEAGRVAIRALAGGPEGVEPGAYDLLIYAGGQLVGARSFRVLDTPPRVFDLRVADVPGPPGAPPGERQFGAGVRVIYLGYRFEGLCPGLDLSHTLYHERQPIQERIAPPGGDPQGQAQVSFQAPGDLPFPPGDYAVAVAVAGDEQARAALTIEAPAVEPLPPAFGDVTLALGVQSDGTSILTAPDDRFDWNTKAVYGIFDYVGMSDGLRWAAVWTREGEDVAREEHFWDVAADGTEGTRWVAYHDPRGRTLPGGTYSVTLYIENVAQRTADFNIRYYVPPE
jgi:hypothetical protein